MRALIDSPFEQFLLFILGRVGTKGRIMDYEFNHNNVFDSTVEHAESRLVRRLFALNQIYAPNGSDSPPHGRSAATT